MASPKPQPGGTCKYLLIAVLCFCTLFYLLRPGSSIDVAAIGTSAAVVKDLWSQNILTDLGTQGVAEPPADDSQSRRDALLADGVSTLQNGAEVAKAATSGTSEQSERDDKDARGKSGTTDHSPFSIEEKHFGTEAFSAKIEEFLQSAPRSSRTLPQTCNAQEHPFDSHCPSWLWLTMYHGPDKMNRPAVFVDIGCNKGYSIASWFEQFAPSSGVNKQSLCRLHRSKKTPKFAGVCRDCNEKPKWGTGGGPAPLAFCIDGSPHTHNVTKQLAVILQKDQPLAQGWKLFHHAMTNASGTITYEDCANEDCGVARPGDKQRAKKRWTTVPALTYDQFAEAHSIGFADLVKIDTEGEEPLIIQGMHESLKAKRVGFLAFEVHGSGKGWFRAFDMARIVDLLDAYGYTCYMDSMAPGQLTLLTGCTGKRFTQSYKYYVGVVPSYQRIRGVIPQWGNAICGLRDDAEITRILTWLNQNPGHSKFLKRDGFWS